MSRNTPGGGSTPTSLLSDMDASRWASEFMKVWNRNPNMDEGWMLSWFACAIMCGYDTAARRSAQSESERGTDRNAIIEECVSVVKVGGIDSERIIVALRALKNAAPQESGIIDTYKAKVERDAETIKAMRDKLAELCDRLDWKGPSREQNITITVREARALIASHDRIAAGVAFITVQD